MKILMMQFLATLHSWSVFGQNVARALISDGHEVDLYSTNGIQYFPEDLKNNLIGFIDNKQLFGKTPNNNYDCQISYTAMKNFQAYLSFGVKNRLGVWAWEWSGKNSLPTGFAKNHKYCDFLCPPSQFVKQSFADSGVPENKMVVIPHGIDTYKYRQTATMNLGTNKKYKILVNIAQNHIRKNIPGMLEAYGKAFTNKSDVCLILKAKDKPITSPFEISLNSCLKDFYQKYPQHAEIKILNEYINDMSALYRSIDSVFSMTFCEGYYLPGLEALCSGKLNITPNWGGQTDFLNNNNALLISGKETRANPKSLYWETKSNATWFEPSIDDAVDKLKYSYNNFETLNKQIELNKENIINIYSWNNIAKQYINLCI